MLQSDEVTPRRKDEEERMRQRIRAEVEKFMLENKMKQNTEYK